MHKVDMMIDFEALGVSGDSVVLSIGIVLFDKDGKIHEELYKEFDPRFQILDGRTVNNDTIGWWRRTNKKEFARLLVNGKDDIAEALPRMVRMLREKYAIDKVWSRHPMDFEIINSILSEKDQFPFYTFADCSTLDEFVKMDRKNNHNALDDAKNQAVQVIRMREEWKNLHALTADVETTVERQDAPVVTK